jgi:hypothetical protein
MTKRGHADVLPFFMSRDDEPLFTQREKESSNEPGMRNPFSMPVALQIPSGGSPWLQESRCLCMEGKE